METVKILKIHRADKKKDGTPYISKDGRPYTRVGIQVEGYQDWLSGFENAVTKSWKEGDTVQILIEKSGDYTNFRTQPKQVTPEDFAALEARVKKLEDMVKTVEDANGDDGVPF